MYHNSEAPVNYRVNENESSRASVVSLKHGCELVLSYHYSLQAHVREKKCSGIMVELQNNSPMGRTRWMLTSLQNREKSFQNLAGSVVDLQRYPLAIQLNVLVVSVFNSRVVDSPLWYVTSFFLTNQIKASITLIANDYHFCIIANFIYLELEGVALHVSDHQKLC